jgi:hypothetical protein
VATDLRSSAEHFDLEAVPAGGHEHGAHILRHALDEIIGKIAKAHPGSLHAGLVATLRADAAADRAVAARVLVTFWSGG